MTDLTAEARARSVRQMFARIAPRYDLVNRLMTFGQDRRWRREAIRRLLLPPQPRVLDIGSGTGDLAFEALRQAPGAFVVAADFTPPMMAVGRQRGRRVQWVVADASRLPFASARFDGIVSGFLLRNVVDLDRVLGEQARVARPGRRLVSLDTTPPRASLLRPLLEFHLRAVIPRLGRWVSGDAEAYNYLPASTERFLSAEDLAERLSAAGFDSVSFVRRMLGTVAIHWGVRRPDRR
jgi:demethylmenaquinone methyltransferase/2-methoxy-6-polyprenyl-1,4-benzoquinol methylase